MRNDEDAIRSLVATWMEAVELGGRESAKENGR
jgi:hypothetical protein